MKDQDRSLDSERFLAMPGIHSQWKSDYLNPDLDRFYDLAFADIIKRVPIHPSDHILDAGCGSGVHTARLARSGAGVTAVDFSECALQDAEATLANSPFRSRIALQRSDLTCLPFADGHFDHVVCWGVLMHIPELELALAELARVLRRNGTLVICENNAFSLDVQVRERAIRGLKRLLGHSVSEARMSERGRECWTDNAEGGLMVRNVNFRYLKAFLSRYGLQQTARTAGQFTEAYTNLPWRAAKRAVYAINEAYYRYLRDLPQISLANIVYYRKSE